MEERIARLTLRFALLALVYVSVVLALYATKGSLVGGFFYALRRLSMWLFPIYLIFTVAGVFVGLYSAWGASTPRIQRRGLTACALSIASIVILLVGWSLLAG